MSKISIELERDSGVYYAGEVVRGTIKLACPKTVTCRSFNVELKGEARVHWHTGSGDNRNDYDGRTIYQHQRFTIRGNFYKTGILDEAGEDANFDMIHKSGLIQIPCTAQEKSSSFSSCSFQIIVRVMDYDWGKKDDILGELVLDVPNLVRAGTQKSYRLTRNGKPEKGEVTMSAKFVPYGVIFPETNRSGAAISQSIKKDYCLVLHIHRATGLRKADWVGKNDVYVQVYRPENAKREIVEGKKLPGPQKRLPIDEEIVAPFAFPLRHDAPPSAEIGVSDKSYIRYTIRAYLDFANWTDPFSKRLITVIPNRPIPKSLLLSPHIAKVGPEPFASCCGFGKYGMGTIKLIMDRRAYAPGEVVDLSKSTVLFEGRKDDMSVEIELEGHYHLSCYRGSTITNQSYRIGSMDLTPNIALSMRGDFRIPHVYPSFWGGINGRTRSLYSCLRWTYSLKITVKGSGYCGNYVQASLPVLICSAPPYASVLEQYQNLSPKQPSITSIWDIFNEAVTGSEEACTTAPSITGPEDSGQIVNLGVPVNTWEGKEDNHNVGEGGKDSTSYQPIITTFDGPSSLNPITEEVVSGETVQSSLDELLQKMDESFDKRLIVGQWIRNHLHQAQQLSPSDFKDILEKVTFSLDQPSVVKELVTAFEGASNLTCQHIVSTMNTCNYQKVEVASIMAPFVSDLQNTEKVLNELEFSFDKKMVLQKFSSL